MQYYSYQLTSRAGRLFMQNFTSQILLVHSLYLQGLGNGFSGDIITIFQPPFQALGQYTVSILRIIDYRATYVYGIGNGCTPLIVLHWAALKRSSKYIALAKIN